MVTSPVDKLATALQAVDWNAQVGEFLKLGDVPSRIAASNMTLAVWSRQLEVAEIGNLAIPFIREMQSSGQNVAVLAGLSLYKAAAGSLRTVLENALYYTYFRSHPVELASVVQGRFYTSKDAIIEFHKTHTVNFNEKQSNVGLITDLQAWYSATSSLVHGQVPGAWITSSSVASTKVHSEVAEELTTAFTSCVSLVNRLFLICLAPHLWSQVSQTAKAHLLKGMAGDKKTALGVDSA